MPYLIVAEPHGMCAGVQGAIKRLEETLKKTQGPVYVLHELVHNTAVTEDFRRRGVRFVEELSVVPQGAMLLIGAHGVSAEMEEKIRRLSPHCADATCPLVKKIHRAAAALTPEQTLVLLGHRGHPEALGILGHSGAGRNFLVSSEEEIEQLPALQQVRVLCQTTFDFRKTKLLTEKLRQRFPDLEFEDGVCNASRCRQQAVRELAPHTDLFLVLGSPHSSNARRLQEVAAQCGSKAFLVDSISELPAELAEARCVGLSSGASTPEYFLEDVRKKLEEKGFVRSGAVPR